MKITINKTVKEVIEIELPAFHKNGWSYLKTIDENNAVKVSLFSFETEITVQNDCGYTMTIDNKWEPITEQEFNEAYDKALRILFSNRPYSKVKVDRITKLPNLTEIELMDFVKETPTNGRCINQEKY